MSQAEALLNTLYVDDDVIVEHDYNEIEPHIVIGIDRFVTVPDILKRIAVQHDHNVRTVTFDCPRYYDGRDMASMKVYINVQAPNRNEGSYVADNVRINRFDGNVMHFDWTITRAITPSDGELRFLVCIKKVDEEGNEENHWNSEICDDMYISKGMEYEEIMFNEHPDIITQLLDRMDTIEYIATPEYMEETVDKWLSQNIGGATGMIEEKGEEILASIPNDYTETSKLAEAGESNARTKADAITRTVTGNAIVAHDSSDDYLRGLKLFGNTTQVTTTGKNLFTVTKDLSSNTGISWDDEKQRLHIASGTYAAVIPLHILENPIPAGTTVTLTVRPDQGYIAAGGHIAVGGYHDDGNGNTGWQCEISIPAITDNAGKTYTRTFTTTDEVNKFVLFLNDQTKVSSEIIFTAQYELGDISSEFERYSGGLVSPCPEYPQELKYAIDPTVHIQGENLFGGEIMAERIYEVSKKSTSVLDKTAKTVTYSGGGLDKAVLVDHGFRKNQQYTLILHGQNTTAAGGYINMGFNYDDDSVGHGAFQFKTHGEDSYAVMTSIEGKNVASLVGKWASGEVCINYEKCGLFEGVITEDDFVSFIGRQSHAINRELLAVGNIRDEVDFDRGVFIQRVKKMVLNGSENWYTTSATRIYLDLEDRATNSGDGYCSHFDYWYNYNGDCIFATNNHIYLGQAASARFSVDTEQWKDFLAENPMTVIYPLETPIVTDLTEEELEWFRNAHTNYHDTTVINSEDAGMELKYNADTEIYVNNLIKMNASIKATTATLSASKWVGTTYGYSQVVAMNGVTPNSKIDLQPSPEQLADLMAAEVSLTTSNNNGVVTIHAIGGYPATDMTMQVQITEVIAV